MATPKENLLSLGHLTGSNRDTFNTFTNRRARSPTRSSTKTVMFQGDFSTQRLRRVMHLQQRWQELKDRESAAQHRNRQLLHHFEEAQESLRDMMARTAAMKTIRMEYERYLEESSPRWEQQLKEKTQAAQKKRTEEYLKMHLENTGQQEATSSLAQPSHSQGPNKKPQAVAPQVYSLNSHDDTSQFPYIHSSWLTQSQSQEARFRVRAPYHPQSASQIPPPFLQPPHPCQLQHLSTQHLWPKQNPPGWDSSQPDYTCPWASGAAGMPSGSGAPWGHLYMGEPPPARVEVHAGGEGSETSTTHSSRRESGGGSEYQELDVKPVRLSSGQADSSESGRDSSRARRERKKKKGRPQRSSSERERCASQESSRASSAIVIASGTVAKASQSYTSSEKSSMSRRRVEKKVADESRMTEKAAKESKSSEGSGGESHNQESQSAGEESASPSEESRSENALNKKSERGKEESGSPEDETGSSQHENVLGFELEEEESSSSEQSRKGGDVEEQKGHQKELGDEEEKADEDGNQDKDVDDEEEVSVGKNTAEEEEETGGEEEQSDEDQQGQEEQAEKLSNTKDTHFSHNEDDEGDSDRSEEKVEEESEDDEEEAEEEEDGDEEEEKEQMSDITAEPEEDRDSEDSIIVPQESRQRKMHVIHEEDSQDEEEEEQSKAGSSDEDEDSKDFGEDIEELLAPQKPVNETRKEEQKTKDKPEAICDTVEIFQVEKDPSAHMDQQSDSDEFDNFYD